MGRTIICAALVGAFGFVLGHDASPNNWPSLLGLMSGATLGAVLGGTAEILAAIKQSRPSQNPGRKSPLTLATA